MEACRGRTTQHSGRLLKCPSVCQSLDYVMSTDSYETHRSTYPSLSDSDKVRLIHLIANVCCAADETLTMTASDDGESPRFDCPGCRTLGGNPDASTCIDVIAKKFAIEIFVCLLQIATFSESRKPRVAAMVSLRRIAKHCDSSEFIDMEVSFAAQWCLKSLHSSQRELRIAAG